MDIQAIIAGASLSLLALCFSIIFGTIVGAERGYRARQDRIDRIGRGTKAKDD